MTDRAGDIAMLIKKHIHKELTEEERGELNDWIDASNENRKVFNELTDEDSLHAAMQELYDFTQSHDRGQSAPVVGLYAKKRNWFNYILAAAIVLAAVSLIWLLVVKNNNKEEKIAVTDTHTKKKDPDIPPGGNKAVLTLQDGSTIALDDAQNGVIAEQGKTVINKRGAELVYHDARLQAKDEATSWNIVTTPRGGQYQLKLPDGSKVWLNAASSIKFPVSFSGKERRVEITGEAYFEVTKDEAHPFIVSIRNTEVRVLGTHFNINAYSDNPQVKTTLLEGSVRITPPAGGHATVLTPGEQAQVSEKGTIRVDDEVDIEKAIAWKNHLFIFKGDGVVDVMNTLSRWYDVDVEYKGSVPDLQFYGIVNMDQPASNVLQLLQMKGGHFQIEHKRIIVTP
ncbi:MULTISPECIES: FecR family protein [Niastella]|uniref:FecR domain-containing protein n=1 Tax=Niastella soli TaxID=2821487 RepID=A0ABS3Z377_9BACT|nr:FecR domain-containing protein [Niastella soli]MBO9204622.1 FecR domain-containing protein [Niastella soli]